MWFFADLVFIIVLFKSVDSESPDVCANGECTKNENLICCLCMTDASDHWCKEETTYKEFTGVMAFWRNAFAKDKLETCEKRCKDKGSTLAQLDLEQHGNEASKEGACSESFSSVHKICENYKDDADVMKLLDEISDSTFMKALIRKLSGKVLKLLKKTRYGS